MFTNRAEMESRTGGQHPNVQRPTSTRAGRKYIEMYTIEARTTQEIFHFHRDSSRPLCKRTLSSGRDGHEPPLAPWRQRTTAGRQMPAISKPMKQHPHIGTKTTDRSSGRITRRPQRIASASEHLRSTAIDCPRARKRCSTISEHNRIHVQRGGSQNGCTQQVGHTHPGSANVPERRGEGRPHQRLAQTRTWRRRSVR